LSEAVDFAATIDEIDDLDNLSAEFGRAMGVFGFDAFACAGHMRNRYGFEFRPLFERMPAGFIESYQANFMGWDPSLPRMLSSNKSFVFSALYRESDCPDDRNERIIDHARAFGLHDGICVPIHHPGDYCGVMVMGGRSPDFARNDLFGIILMAMRCHDRARELASIAGCEAEPRPTTGGLTGREVECVYWVAHGKSDWDIGEILGISRSTVHFHVENAKKKFHVRTRVQLVVEALRTGAIHL